MFRLLLLIALLLPLAQPDDPNAHITWPPPVLVVRGDEPIIGTANLPNMAAYLIEYRPLDDELNPIGEDWQVAIDRSADRVIGDQLGMWDTTLAPDGLYELRMTIEVTEGLPVYVVVGPLRVENAGAPPVPPPTQAPQIVPTAPPPTAPPPTATPFDPTPRVEARLDANVRSGDGVIYDVIAGLRAGQTARVVGISSTGSGWYLIDLPDGRRGWISPTVVILSGDARGLPFVAPPPPPTPTPIPVTPTPTTTVNLVAGNIRLDPATPTCLQTFNIYVDVANFGTETAPSGTISIIDFAGGNSTSTIGGFPSIAPGQTVTAGPIPLTVSFNFDEDHTLRAIVDPNNLIAETNEFDNTREIVYRLGRGGC